MPVSDTTYIGQVASVTGSVIRVRLSDEMPSTLIMIAGESYRIGQIGGFVRIPLGYMDLFAVCTQVGADAAPPVPLGQSSVNALETDLESRLSGFRWMTVTLFGEGFGGKFERGVAQYPTIGDEVHLVTSSDLRVIYSRREDEDCAATVCIGEIAASSSIPADINVAGLVSRHSAVVGSTGSGKSNLVTVLLEAVSHSIFPNSRAVVIDPHGEYASAFPETSRVFRVRPQEGTGDRPLWVPFWALPFLELQELTLGQLQPAHEASIRERVVEMKTDSVTHLDVKPPVESIIADTPVPFSINRLWYELDRFERMTFQKSGQQTPESANAPSTKGDPDRLLSDTYPPASPYNQPPYKNSRKRNIERHLDLMKTRIKDGRFSFLFAPGDGFEPNLEGKTQKDLDILVRDWVGHDRPITVFDVSGLPSDTLSVVVGTILRVIYDMLFWAQDLPVGGRGQPLLIAIDEAHRFIPEGADTVAHRTLTMIAKEGRKYGVGLMLVSQRPSELDSSVLSQCGSFAALRLTNLADQSKVSAAIPDDLGGLIDQLPALRTGEGIFIGEIMPIPSRVRVFKATGELGGSDPSLPEAWQRRRDTSGREYRDALLKWRSQSLSAKINAEVAASRDLDDDYSPAG